MKKELQTESSSSRYITPNETIIGRVYRMRRYDADPKDIHYGIMLEQSCVDNSNFFKYYNLSTKTIGHIAHKNIWFIEEI